MNHTRVATIYAYRLSAGPHTSFRVRLLYKHHLQMCVDDYAVSEVSATNNYHGYRYRGMAAVNHSGPSTWRQK